MKRASLAALAALALLLGCLLLSQVSVDGSYLGDILFPSLLAAVGLGFAFVPVTIASVTGTRPDEAGLASGLINTSQQIGGALGVAIAATIANTHTKTLITDTARISRTSRRPR